MATNSIRVDASTSFVRRFAYFFITLLTILCLIPFLLMLGTSFTSESAVREFGFNIWPKDFDILAYKLVFENPDMVIGSYIVTILMTVFGTIIGLFLVSMAGYALQRPDFAFRNQISFYIYFTTLFSGGLVPFYLLIVRILRLKNNYLAVFLPSLMSPWLIILMKNFTKSIPFAITESAKIDGASDFRIFLNIILPMSKPALATVGLFLALTYWNEWYNSMLFLEANMDYRPLQLFLYNVVNKVEYIKNSAASSNIPPMDVPLETMKMATAIVATGPIVLVYPFIQKYFIKGITIGAVKG